jgi:hypothetical protein
MSSPAEFMTRKTILLALLANACRPAGPRSGPPNSQREEPMAAEHVVQRQYDAYNRHDLDAFVAAHAPNVRAYSYPDSLLFEGRDSLRARFGRLFSSAPQVHANIDSRMALGNIVVWKETATGLPEGKTNTGIFVWEVHNGQITRITRLVAAH